jgi:predicted DNA binding protein
MRTFTTVKATNSKGMAQPVEVEFRLDDPAYPFVAISEGGEVVASLERMLPRDGERYAEFFSITGAAPDRIVELAEDSDRVLDVRVVNREGDCGLFEFTVSVSQRPCPAVDLSELGAIPREVTGEGGEGTIVVEIEGRENTSELISEFLERHPEAKLVSKRGIDDKTPLLAANELDEAIDDALTERQREVLLTAFDAGYYEWPQTCTGEEVADDLGIASSTFSEHIHAGERKLLELLFEGSQ